MLFNKIRFDDGCGFVLDTINQPGADVIVQKVDGWYGVAPKSEHISRITDGNFPGLLWREGRRLTLGVWEYHTSRESVESRARQVAAVFRSGEVGDGTLTVSGITEALTAEQIALDGEPKVDTELGVPGLRAARVMWELPLIAHDPYLYGERQVTTAFTRGAGMGLEYPLHDDQDTGVTTGVWEYGDPLPAAATLTNRGTHPAYPIIHVTGDMRSGFILRISGDRHEGRGGWGVTYASDVPDGQTVVVDMAGSVTVDGMDRSWALTQRDWGGVAPGGRVTVSLQPIAQGQGAAQISLYSTYL